MPSYGWMRISNKFKCEHNISASMQMQSMIRNNNKKTANSRWWILITPRLTSTICCRPIKVGPNGLLFINDVLHSSIMFEFLQQFPSLQYPRGHIGLSLHLKAVDQEPIQGYIFGTWNSVTCLLCQLDWELLVIQGAWEVHRNHPGHSSTCWGWESSCCLPSCCLSYQFWSHGLCCCVISWWQLFALPSS